MSWIATGPGILTTGRRTGTGGARARKRRPPTPKATSKTFNLKKKHTLLYNFKIVFWAGDKAKTAHEAKLDDVKGLIAKRDWQTLRKNDELCRELDAGRVFAGFTDCIDWEKVRTLQLIIRFSLNN
eukprot:COSAG04_NODE_454_length_14092_cov_330.378261_1_plen_126_part_00